MAAIDKAELTEKIILKLENMRPPAPWQPGHHLAKTEVETIASRLARALLRGQAADRVEQIVAGLDEDVNGFVKGLTTYEIPISQEQALRFLPAYAARDAVGPEMVTGKFMRFILDIKAKFGITLDCESDITPSLIRRVGRASVGRLPELLHEQHKTLTDNGFELSETDFVSGILNKENTLTPAALLDRAQLVLEIRRLHGETVLGAKQAGEMFLADLHYITQISTSQLAAGVLHARLAPLLKPDSALNSYPACFRTLVQEPRKIGDEIVEMLGGDPAHTIHVPPSSDVIVSRGKLAMFRPCVVARAGEELQKMRRQEFLTMLIEFGFVPGHEMDPASLPPQVADIKRRGFDSVETRRRPFYAQKYAAELGENAVSLSTFALCERIFASSLRRRSGIRAFQHRNAEILALVA